MEIRVFSGFKICRPRLNIGHPELDSGSSLLFFIDTFGQQSSTRPLVSDNQEAFKELSEVS